MSLCQLASTMTAAILLQVFRDATRGGCRWNDGARCRAADIAKVDTYTDAFVRARGSAHIVTFHGPLFFGLSGSPEQYPDSVLFWSLFEL